MTRVLFVGVGGLGCPAAIALLDGAARSPELRARLAIGLLDDDTVAASNLHRQILFRDGDVGRPKVEVARERLVERHPWMAGRIEASVGRFDDASPSPWRRYDVVVDGTDSIAGKLALNRAAVAAVRDGRRGALVHAGAVRWRGQLLVVRAGGPCLACLFDAIGPDAATASDGEACENACAAQGVVGPAVGVVGALAGTRALALTVENAQAASAPPVEPLTVYDGLAGRFSSLTVRRDPDCAVCGERAMRGAA